MRQLVYTMFISNNCTSFYLCWKENLINIKKTQNIMKLIVALSEGGCETFEKGHSNKMMRFLLKAWTSWVNGAHWCKVWPIEVRYTLSVLLQILTISTNMHIFMYNSGNKLVIQQIQNPIFQKFANFMHVKIIKKKQIWYTPKNLSVMNTKCIDSFCY